LVVVQSPIASIRWLQVFAQTLALAPAAVEVITVCDREADIYEMFASAQEQEAPLLVRASSDRALLDDEDRKLWPKADAHAPVNHIARHGTYCPPGGPLDRATRGLRRSVAHPMANPA
jgi:hypothetical protein